MVPIINEEDVTTLVWHRGTGYVFTGGPDAYRRGGLLIHTRAGVTKPKIVAVLEGFGLKLVRPLCNWKVWNWDKENIPYNFYKPIQEYWDEHDAGMVVDRLTGKPVRKELRSKEGMKYREFREKGQ